MHNLHLQDIGGMDHLMFMAGPGSPEMACGGGGGGDAPGRPKLVVDGNGLAV